MPLPTDFGQELSSVSLRASSLTQISGTAGAGEFGLPRAADDTFVIRPTGAWLWPVIR
jgi:hypothetical protein